jgi:hypothetical protein
MPAFDIEAVDDLVRSSLTAFIEGFTLAKWWGKERDCVNRFVHGVLMRRCQPSTILAHPTQIGIEVGWLSRETCSLARLPRKDVVIWPEPWMSCWNEAWEAINFPMAILEWKALRTARRVTCHAHDRQWLSGLAKERAEFAGYSVAMNRERGCSERLLVVRSVSSRGG